MTPRQKLWLDALQPPMYSVAVVPVLVGTAAAWWQMGQVDGLNLALFLLGGVLILVWLNFSNDAFDASTGIDAHNDESLVTLSGSLSGVLLVAHVCLGLGLLAIASISFRQADPSVLATVLLCCGLGYAYQGPPWRWGYLGLGEPICFLTFGPMAVMAAYYAQTQLRSPLIWATAIPVGLTTALILFCSHFHQIKDDAAAGKRSPIVRLGTATAAQLIPLWLLAAYGSVAIAMGLRLLPPLTGLYGLGIPLALRLVSLTQRYHGHPERIRKAKIVAALHHLLCSSGLIVGLLWRG